MGHPMDVNEIIRTLANMSNFDRQNVFFALSMFFSIHQPILDKTTSKFVKTFKLQGNLLGSEGVLEGVPSLRRSRRLQRGSSAKPVVVESSDEDKSKSDADFEVRASEENLGSSTEDTSQPKKKIQFILLVTHLFCMYCRS
jgi:hypothetical protein